MKEVKPLDMLLNQSDSLALAASEKVSPENTSCKKKHCIRESYLEGQEGIL